MVNRFYVLLMMFLFGVVPLAGCQQHPTPKASVEQLHVMVSIAPQKYFVERDRQRLRESKRDGSSWG